MSHAAEKRGRELLLVAAAAADFSPAAAVDSSESVLISDVAAATVLNP